MGVEQVQRADDQPGGTAGLAVQEITGMVAKPNLPTCGCS
jgi:hypothetical protein